MKVHEHSEIGKSVLHLENSHGGNARPWGEQHTALTCPSGFRIARGWIRYRADFTEISDL